MGEKNSVIIAPRSPVIHTNLLTIEATRETRFGLPVICASEISLTALVSNPKFVSPEINSIVELKRPTIPIP